MPAKPAACSLASLGVLRKEPPSAEELAGMQRYISGTFVLNNSNLTLGGVNNLTFTGPVTVNDTTDANGAAYTNTANVASTSVQTLTLNGSITGRTFSSWA